MFLNARLSVSINCVYHELYFNVWRIFITPTVQSIMHWKEWKDVSIFSHWLPQGLALMDAFKYFW